MNLAQRFLNVPLALLPREGQKLLRMLEPRCHEEDATGIDDAGLPILFPGQKVNPTGRLPAAITNLLVISEAQTQASKPYAVTDGIAIVPIRGILVHGATWWFDETDYDSIRSTFDAAMADAEVRAIVLHIDSPGGEVAGCFDLADAIYAARGKKPIWAILNESAYSAAYALACCANKITVPRTGGTGSIGVVCMHVDVTAALEQWGIKVTTIQFGARKTDCYPTTPLSDAARERMQADIDTLGEMFVELVARGRGLTTAEVRKTQAGVFLGAAGKDQGLADEVMSPDEAFLALVRAQS